MDKKFQVFISSTFEDLKEERRAVTEMILELGHIPVGMELFQASNESQWTHIQRRIEDCDYYLVIVAERYGSEVKIKGKNKSYTQMEYEFAVKTGVPVAAFLLDPSVRGNWPQNRTEPEKRTKVEAFRTLCGRKLCKFWKTPDDLAKKVSTSLNELIKAEPRKGWISADQLPSAVVTDELARLSEENRSLRERVEAFERQAGGVQVPPEIMAKIRYLEGNCDGVYDLGGKCSDMMSLIDCIDRFQADGHNYRNITGIAVNVIGFDMDYFLIIKRELNKLGIMEEEKIRRIGIVEEGRFSKLGADIIMYYRLLQAEKQQQKALQP